MAITTPTTRPYSIQARKKFGRATNYGQKINGRITYGEEEPIIGLGQYGYPSFGEGQYAEVLAPFGIYKVSSESGKQETIKKEFYIPANPQTEAQQAHRTTFANAVAGWQVLTTEQKAVYNTRAKYKNLSGYNLYLREYLLSN